MHLYIYVYIHLYHNFLGSAQNLVVLYFSSTDSDSAFFLPYALRLQPNFSDRRQRAVATSVSGDFRDSHAFAGARILPHSVFCHRRSDFSDWIFQWSVSLV